MSALLGDPGGGVMKSPSMAASMAAVQVDDRLLTAIGGSRVVLAEVADRVARVASNAPRPPETDGAYEFWRGYRTAANEVADVLRGLASDDELVRALGLDEYWEQ